MSLRRKLVLVVVFTSVFVTLVLAVSGTRIQAMLSSANARQRLTRETRLLEALVEATPTEDLALHERLARLATPLGMRIQLLDELGQVHYDSGEASVAGKPLRSMATAPAVEIAREHGLGWNEDRIANGEVVLRVARRIEGHPQYAYLVGSAASRGDRIIGLSEAWPLILVLLLAFVLLAIAVSVLAGRMLRPLERLTVATERVAAGALDEQLPPSAQVEVMRLAASVEKMRASLVAQLKDLERERRLLRTTTDGLEEGLLLVSATGRVLLANRAFQQILSLSFDVTARHLSEVVRHPTLLGAIEGCLEHHSETDETISGAITGGRSFHLHVSSVELVAGHGALVVFFDVTRLEALERMRRQFVADVSHELKTPVTAIRGAVETLLEADLDVGPTEMRFLEIAARQASRMEALIKDLLDLSRIETGAIPLEVTEVLLAPVAEAVAEAGVARRGQSDLRIELDVPSDLTVPADALRLEQVLQNLVDNAIKFSPPGGCVTVSAFPTDATVVLRVRDEGPGIPPEAVDKVFNRFFRIDEARNRQHGGTGIGLSIVKHLMKLHHGSVRVESPPGQGSTFILEFPKRVSVC